MSIANANAKLYAQLVPKIAKASPQAILVVVANPLDLMTYVTLKLSGFPPSRVLGTGTLIDTARFRGLLAQQ
jgi:L-lactate dehydrogenase